MAYNTKPIVTDVDGNPISQYYNPDTDSYEPVEGSHGANKVMVENNDLSLIPILDKLSQLTGTVIDEETRKSNELQRIDNEDTRQSNENIRNTNEIERIENENIRIENENTRIENENIRKANEQNRVELYNDLINKVNSGYFDGKNLEFHWRGTELGVRVEGETEYIYVDLKGETGNIDNLTRQHIETALGYTPVKSVNNVLPDETGNVELDIDTSEIENRIGNVENDLVAHKADGASHSKTARFVVGTSTSGWTEKDCDYLCDGTNDQEEIIQALNALPATGGEVVILDGTYNITASINIPKDNVSLRGNGNATILKRMYNSTNTNNGPTARGLITLNEKSGCKIQGLQIDGNKATYTASYNYGILLYSSSNNTVTGNTCNNNNNGIRLEISSNNTVTGNTCNNNNNGILLYSFSNNTIIGNFCNNNNNGIYLYSSSNNTVTGNTCNNNNNGIYLSSSSNNNTVTGNTCNNNNNGIYLYSSSNNTVTGNTCIRGTGQSSDYTSSQYTIRLGGSGNLYNLISSNNCMGKDVVIDGGTGNTSVNNKYN